MGIALLIAVLGVRAALATSHRVHPVKVPRHPPPAQAQVLLLLLLVLRLRPMLLPMGAVVATLLVATLPALESPAALPRGTVAIQRLTVDLDVKVELAFSQVRRLAIAPRHPPAQAQLLLPLLPALLLRPISLIMEAAAATLLAATSPALESLAVLRLGIVATQPLTVGLDAKAALAFNHRARPAQVLPCLLVLRPARVLPRSVLLRAHAYPQQSMSP